MSNAMDSNDDDVPQAPTPKRVWHPVTRASYVCVRPNNKEEEKEEKEIFLTQKKPVDFIPGPELPELKIYCQANGDASAHLGTQVERFKRSEIREWLQENNCGRNRIFMANNCWKRLPSKNKHWLCSAYQQVIIFTRFECYSDEPNTTHHGMQEQKGSIGFNASGCARLRNDDSEQGEQPPPAKQARLQ